MAEIEFKEGPCAGRRTVLTSNILTMGRHPEMDLPLDDTPAKSGAPQSGKLLPA